jgi:hypothetical protein
MKKLFLALMIVTAALGLSGIGASGQSTDSSATADHTPPSYDMKAQALFDLEAVQKKFVDLANTACGGRALWNSRSHGCGSSSRVRSKDV